jgi:metal-responsive CopG/Arc/MetJ family transcriptional regulator
MSVRVYFEGIRIVTVKMPESLYEALDRYAINHNLSRSEVVRLAILRFLEEESRK